MSRPVSAVSDVTERDAPLAELLAAAYPVLVAGEAFETTSGGDRLASWSRSGAPREGRIRPR